MHFNSCLLIMLPVSDLEGVKRKRGTFLLLLRLPKFQTNTATYEVTNTRLTNYISAKVVIVLSCCDINLIYVERGLKKLLPVVMSSATRCGTKIVS